jgi:adenylosuccinate synthase
MNLVVIGAQWGDEGKGKIVDYLSRGADMVLRYSGGANAGHTIVHGGVTFKLHLVPSGITSPGRVVVLGIGMVIDPGSLFEELEGLERAGIDWKGRVKVADRAHLVLPRYRDIDREQEKARAVPLGTTGRGIGVTYSLKSSRDGIRVVDLFDDAFMANIPPGDREYLEPFRDRLAPMVVDASVFIHGQRGRNVLFEGAQGTLLDLDFGTYPFVSSGNSSAGGAPMGGGIGPTAIDRCIGVCKAYSTRVGSGPFPSESVGERDGDLGDRLRELGREYGTTTGRPRRCGWLDLVALRYACRSNSLDSLALTKLDVLSSFDEVQACVAYRCGDARLEDFPASRAALESARPLTERLPGWRQPLGGCRRFEDLPPQARNFVRFIEESAGVAVSIVSVGPEREDTITRQDPWTRS